MDATESGISMDVNEIQPLNAESPIDTTDPGILTDASELHPLNPESPIDITVSGISMDFNEIQPLNAESPIDTTDPGILMDASELHPLNTESPIDTTVSGSVLSNYYNHYPDSITFPWIPASKYTYLMELDLDKCRDLFEVIDGRDGRHSTIIISQFPVKTWFDMFKDGTYADACLSRLTDKRHSYRIEMNGRSMRDPV